MRHLRASLAVVEERERQPWRLVGTVQDITGQRRAEREVAAHLATSQTLADWLSLEESAELLLRDLAAALDFAVAVL
jgi:hypothetical protein